jgi:hypothetical protein
VHLGDRDVPNALVFIDKYTQVARILHPIVHAVDSLPVPARGAGMASYIDQTFGGADTAVMDILAELRRRRWLVH